MALCAQKVAVRLLSFCIGAAVGGALPRAGEPMRRCAAALLCGTAFAAIAARFGVTGRGVQMWILLGLLGAAALSDLERMEIPDRIPIAAAVSFFVFLPFSANPPDALVRGLLGAAAIGGGTLTLACCADRICGRETLGGGDVKLFAVLGLYFGVLGGLFAVAASCLTGLAVCAAKGLDKNRPFPFAPSIAVGAFLTATVGADCIQLYLRTLGIGAGV